MATITPTQIQEGGGGTLLISSPVVSSSFFFFNFFWSAKILLLWSCKVCWDVELSNINKDKTRLEFYSWKWRKTVRIWQQSCEQKHWQSVLSTHAHTLTIKPALKQVKFVAFACLCTFIINSSPLERECTAALHEVVCWFLLSDLSGEFSTRHKHFWTVSGPPSLTTTTLIPISHCTWWEKSCGQRKQKQDNPSSLSCGPLESEPWKLIKLHAAVEQGVLLLPPLQERGGRDSVEVTASLSGCNLRGER